MKSTLTKNLRKQTPMIKKTTRACEQAKQLLPIAIGRPLKINKYLHMKKEFYKLLQIILSFHRRTYFWKMF
jgi:hypothetical protein